MSEPTDPKAIGAGIAAVGIISGWLLSLVRHWRKIGRQDQVIKNIDQRLQSVELEQKALEHQWRVEQKKFRDEMQLEVKAIHNLIESYFLDSEKNPRILTVAAHDQICGERKQDLHEIKGHIEEIFTTMRAMGENVAVISDRYGRGRA